MSKKQIQTADMGQAEANFDALFLQHWEPLCRLLYSLVGDWDEAQDLALDTFMQLYQRPPSEPDRLGGWLHRVATNLGLNALRSRKRRTFYENQASSERTPVWSPDNSDGDPPRMLESAQEREQVRSTLLLLKPRSAELLILRYSGLSYQEIAAALGIAPGSVGTLLARAEKEFKNKFDRWKDNTRAVGKE